MDERHPAPTCEREVSYLMAVEDEILGQMASPTQEGTVLDRKRRITRLPTVLRALALAETDISPSFHTVPFECAPVHS